MEVDIQVLERDITGEKHILFYALVGGKIVGTFAVYHLDRSTETPLGVDWFVVPEYRRSLVGMRLLDRVTRYLRGEGITQGYVRLASHISGLTKLCETFGVNLIWLRSDGDAGVSVYRVEDVRNG